MDVVMPQLGETVKEGTVTVWHKKVGDPVQQGELLFEVSTDKVDTEIPAPASGILSALLVPEGQTVDVGTPLAIIDEQGKTRSEETPANLYAAALPPRPSEPPALLSAVQSPTPPSRHREGEAPLSPVVRKLLAEHQLDPAEIRATGADGRITRNDVLAHLERRRGTGAAPDDQRLPLTRIRKRTAEQMALSWRTIPHVAQAVEVDFQAVEEARRAHGDAWKTREGWALTYLPFVAHAVCASIADFPAVNASFEGDSLLLHRRVNLGIAVDLGEEGLIVPVVKDADRKSLSDLSRAIRSLVEKARSKRLTPDDLTEGTYTLSNSGSFGTLLTAPIINPPQVAILSIDAVERKPVVVNGPDGETIAIRPVGVLTQSFDHRAFDGAYSAAFLRRLKVILEDRDWSKMLGGAAQSASSARSP